jgi:D-alanine-D-alanine ligase
MAKKLRVAILFGGKSAEHEISLQSARNVFSALDKSRFDPVLIGIDKQGKWHLNSADRFLVNENNPKLIALNKSSIDLSMSLAAVENQIRTTESGDIGGIDVVFPVLHGPFGEDGSIQGLLKLANVPFVGSGVLGSALGMDKVVMKKLFRDASIPTAKFVHFSSSQRGKLRFSEIHDYLGVPFFVKPANLGSSVGISKVKSESGFSRAIDEAFKYDRKIIVEENVEGREIECSVLGNEDPIASVPGEVICTSIMDDFYSYQAKYIDEHGATLQIPAQLDQNVVTAIQNLAIKAFETLCCEGMALVDFFLKPNGIVYVNELNTIPGFTSISMYPKLWEASGKSYTQLISDLIDLAIRRFEQEKNLRTSRD